MKVAILGMGAMGARMANNVLKAGHELTVWNRNIERSAPLAQLGATVASSPREAARAAEIVMSMVRDNEAAIEVWLEPKTGALGALSADAIGIECSTLTIACVRQLADEFGSRKRCFLDAPVAGTTPQAEAAQLVFFVGGEASVLERAKPLLASLGKAVQHAGGHGAGAAVKLVVNGLFGIQLAALAELLSFVRRAGFDAARTLEIVSQTPVCSAATSASGEAMLAARFEPMFPVNLVEKDFGYIGDSAAASSAEVPLVSATHRVYAAAIEAGCSDENITAVAKLYTE